MGIYDREYYRDGARGPGFFSGVAPACKALILVQVLLFIGQAFFPHLVHKEWFVADGPLIFEHFQVHRLLTAPFVPDEANLISFIFNLWLFWFVGHEVESLYGSREFAAMSLTAAFLTTFCGVLVGYFAPGGPAPVPLYGSWPTVLAVLVLFTLHYPHREILLFFILPVQMWLIAVGIVGINVLILLQSPRQLPAGVAAVLTGAAYGFLYKTFDLRWSRLGLGRRRVPRFRVVAAEPREAPAPLPTTAMRPSSTAAGARPAPAVLLQEDQLDAKLDEVLAKIAREGRDHLTDEENRVLQEASRRARDRRRDRF